MRSSASTPQLLMIGPLLPALVERIEQAYQVHRFWELDDPQGWLRTYAERIDAIATSGVFGASAELIEALPNLKAIISFGVGYDSIAVDTAKKRGIAVTNTPGVLDNCVADTAVAILLAVGRRISEADRFVRAGSGSMRASRWLAASAARCAASSAWAILAGPSPSASRPSA
ncbi:hypothetical protein [Pseudomonas sp. OHS18]|uniref:hypothetical protein n=1 Tax=Pseudomonas sp. OHS18 TaxID=3399679 RepID=UPI003A89AF18